MKLRLLPILAIPALALAACLGDTPTGPQCRTVTNTQASVSGDTVVTTTGLRILETKAGTGATAASCDLVAVHYTLRLLDGTKIDSSLDRNQPFEFRIGADGVIPGFEQGVVGLRSGGARRLIVPPALGYGAQGSGPVPPNATLVFDVQLLGVSR